MKKRNILIGVISVLLVLSSVAGAAIDYSKYYNRYFVKTDLLRSKITSDGSKQAKLDNSIYLTMEIVNGWTKGNVDYFKVMINDKPYYLPVSYILALDKKGDLDEAINNKDVQIFKAVSSQKFGVSKIVMFETGALANIEGVRAAIDSMSISRGTYNLIIDFDLMNKSKSDITLLESDLSLIDDAGYSYTPTYAPMTKGNISGKVRPGSEKRGEVAFEVPNENSSYILELDSSRFGGKVKYIQFKIVAKDIKTDQAP